MNQQTRKLAGASLLVGLLALAAPAQAVGPEVENIGDRDQDGIDDLGVSYEVAVPDLTLTYATVGYRGACYSSTGWTCGIVFESSHGVRTVGPVSTGSGTLSVSDALCYEPGGSVGVSCSQDCFWDIGENGCGVDVGSTIFCGETRFALATTASNFGTAGDGTSFTNTFCT